MATRKLLGKVIAQARASHTGRDGDLFFDDSSNQFFISDGSTAGGVPLALNNLVNVVAVTDATLAPTVAQSGSIFSITAAAGCVVTLPAASAGLNYSFHLAATVTSNTFTINAASSADVLQGNIICVDKDEPGSVTATNAGATIAVDTPAADDHQIVQDGDTKGRFLGTKIDYVCITDALWYVTGFSFFNGSVATMFT
tara:strand:+ start:188 stop:781 length:594 start_codon:yes stop_codon:yes gene_type:complete